jgi:MFS transporter, UMF1 family
MSSTLEQPQAIPPIRVQPTKLSTFAWALYDMANTVYSAAIISIYFPAYVKDDLKINDIWYALPTAISLLIVGLFSPLMGAISDRGGNRMTWLVWSTALSVSSLFLMGVVPLAGMVIALFVVANASYQAALMFYDALLPSVSSPQNWGKVSGLGVGLGYFGGLIGFLVVPAIAGLIYGSGYANAATFIPTAVIYLLLSLPCFFLVKEKHYTVKKKGEKLSFGRTLSNTWRTILAARQYKGLFIFLISNFFYSDALNTVITAMGIYSTEVIGFTPGERNGFLAFATIFAVVGSLIFGWVSDRIGPKASLNISLGMWTVLFIITIAAPPVWFFFWIGGPLAGIALGSVWVATRTLMIELTPPERLGEFMGLYNLTGKFSAVLGPLTWGITLAIFDPAKPEFAKVGYQIAVSMLLVLIIVGWVLHQFVPKTNRKARAQEYIEAEVN